MRPVATTAKQQPLQPLHGMGGYTLPTLAEPLSSGEEGLEQGDSVSVSPSQPTQPDRVMSPQLQRHLMASDSRMTSRGVTPQTNLQSAHVSKQVQVIQEKDGLVVRLGQNLIFLPGGNMSRGAFVARHADEHTALEPGEFRLIPSRISIEDERVLSNVRAILADVYANRIPIDTLDSKEKWRLHWIERARFVEDDAPDSLLTAGSEFDGILINIFGEDTGTHVDFMDAYQEATLANDVLTHLSKRIHAHEERNLDRLINSGRWEVVRYTINGGYNRPSKKMMYRLYAKEQDVIYAANHNGLRTADFNEAREFLAKKLVKTMAGHETLHHVFHNILSDQDRVQWVDYFRFSDAAYHLEALAYLIKTGTLAFNEVQRSVWSKVIAYYRNPERLQSFKEQAIASGLEAGRFDEIVAAADPNIRLGDFLREILTDSEWYSLCNEMFAYRGSDYAFRETTFFYPPHGGEIALLKQMNVLPQEY